MKPRLIVHGGAWNIPEEHWEDHLKGVQNAIKSTFSKMNEGMTALDAVEHAVKILELDSTFDAGKGAFLNEKGEVELDAIIMDGRNLEFGAVGALQNILHPVSVAKHIMEKTEHCFLVGDGALEFALKMGIEEIDPKELLTERELKFYFQIKNDQQFKTHHPFANEPRDTVGAVALDEYGNFAVATSTGGTARKLKGRVGDCPIVGSGAYVDNEQGGVSATGWGESIMKVVLCKTVCDQLLNLGAKKASQFGIDILQRKVNGLGGVISIDKRGNYGIAFNTPKMARAWVNEEGKVESRIH